MKILVSACLMGEPVRFDGKAKRRESSFLERWQQQGRLVGVCPELQGGLGVPREPAEIVGGTGADVLAGKARVCTLSGRDVTPSFLEGARRTLALAQEAQAVMAILKARSPSCGSQHIYDGSHGKKLIPGSGVTVALLAKAGIPTFDEEHLEEAAAYLASIAEP